MLTNITFDNFHPVAGPIAEKARRLNYKTVEFGGHSYKGMAIEYEPEMFWDFLSAKLNRDVKPFEVSHNGGSVKLQYFRLGMKDDSSTTYIHVDSSCAQFACVWYLSEPPSGVVAGTAFWRHKETGLEAIGGKDLDNKELLEKLDSEGADESKWQMTGLVGQKFNRLTIYPTSLFHSRFPQDAWGNDATDGRIVYTAFFN